MKKLWVVIPLALTVVAITAISFSVAFAEGDGDGDSNTGILATKVAEILGLDAAVVGDAIKQAREELKDEVIKEKLTGLVEEGRMTQQQAGEYLEWIQLKPEGLPPIRKRFFGKPGRQNKGWAGPGPRGHFNKGPSFEGIEKKLNAMVENGDITQDEADAKLEAIRDKGRRPWDHFKKGPSFEGIEKKLNAMVENGDITQEEADAKLER